MASKYLGTERGDQWASGRYTLHPLGTALPAIVLLSFWLLAVGFTVRPGELRAEGLENAGAAKNYTAILEAGQSLRHGQYVVTIDRLTTALTQTPEEDWAGRVELLAHRAEAYQALGYLRQATADLELAMRLAVAKGAANVGRLRGSLGRVYAAAGRFEVADRELQATLSHARLVEDPYLEAITLNSIGNLVAAEGKTIEASKAYGLSRQIAQGGDLTVVDAIATLNSARLLLGTGSLIESEQMLILADSKFGNLPDSSQKALGLVSIGRSLMRVAELKQQTNPDRRSTIYAKFSTAAAIAQGLGDRRTESFAVGYAAQLYESVGRLDEALNLTRQALFLAQQASSPDVSYLWDWQVGRIKRTKGDNESALSAYRQAVRTIESIRTDLVLASGSDRSTFKESVRPTVLGLADLLLEMSRAADDPKRKQTHLLEARQTVELLKSAELEDYFRDECVAELQAKVQTIDRLEPKTAAIYPIIFPDRVELLLSLPDGMDLVSSPIRQAQLEALVLDFRRQLETRTTRRYVRPAQALYKWLIRPIEPILQAHDIETIVFIPSDSLTTIPIAALHDGEAHLVERFAVAVAPGLTLIDPRSIRRDKIDIMANGLTESVQGFPSLPHVDAELSSILAMYGGAQFKDEGFQIDAIEKALNARPFSIIHVASHAKFAPNSADSFLLAYDGKLTFDGLEQFVKLSQFRDEPVELLTLSACATAVGDERAALGLAGIAIKAGARSALASLWLVNDEATSLLITDFYEALSDPSLSKAAALRQAQLALLSDVRYRHPVYWAAFLLIGNWL